MTLPLLDPETAAALLCCTPETIEDRLRDGTLPGVKFGRSWVIPTQALEQTLCELALTQARERRKAVEQAPATPVVDRTGRRRTAPPITAPPITAPPTGARPCPLP